MAGRGLLKPGDVFFQEGPMELTLEVTLGCDVFRVEREQKGSTCPAASER